VLLRFRVANVRSLREEQELSFVASEGDEPDSAARRVDTGTFGGVCGQVVTRLPFTKALKDAANLKLVLPHQVIGGFDEARKRVLRMNAQHGGHVALTKRDPYTDVHVFVEQGLGITSS
jgi:hypothetical protein